MGEAPLTGGGRRLRPIALALALLAPTAAAAPALVAEGACRDGVPNGAYTLRGADGSLRVAGAFAKGVRTGTFLFWSTTGARVAVVPYEDGRKTGTVAVWHAPRAAGGDAPRKSESAWVDGRLHGETRSWHPGGKPRTELRYERGELVEAKAWTAAGARLPEAEARAGAVRDAATDVRFYATLEALIDENRPRCE